jgi:hypothetical protein
MSIRKTSSRWFKRQQFNLRLVLIWIGVASIYCFSWKLRTLAPDPSRSIDGLKIEVSLLGVAAIMYFLFVRSKSPHLAALSSMIVGMIWWRLTIHGNFGGLSMSVSFGYYFLGLSLECTEDWQVFVYGAVLGYLSWTILFLLAFLVDRLDSTFLSRS